MFFSYIINPTFVFHGSVRCVALLYTSFLWQPCTLAWFLTASYITMLAGNITLLPPNIGLLLLNIALLPPNIGLLLLNIALQPPNITILTSNIDQLVATGIYAHVKHFCPFYIQLLKGCGMVVNTTLKVCAMALWRSSNKQPVLQFGKGLTMIAPNNIIYYCLIILFFRNKFYFYVPIF